ncbi:phage head-tail joining protein [Sphingobium sp. Z007]|uniref:phage head-tail joining protein n=1 Tax=Sphingobium sp. Z007 TaxID=627495 RepID=UPI000B4A2A2C|nr:hypothetical protein [Sphingobium sp. Z007]
MAFQQSDLDRLDTAIGSGIRKVTFADGRSTEYQNLDDMLRAREAIVGILAKPAPGTTGRRRFIVGRVGRL